MNYKRVTVSLPTYVYEDLVTLLPRGGISSFVAEATEDKVLEHKINKKDPVEEFLALRNGLPKLTDKQIFAAIRKGRM